MVSTVAHCFNMAKKNGLPLFAVQNGNECFSSKDSLATYSKHGPSSKCKAGGMGGWWSIDVYIMIGINKLYKYI